MTNSHTETPPTPAPRLTDRSHVPGHNDPATRELADALEQARLKSDLGDSYGAGQAIERAQGLLTRLGGVLVAALLLAVAVAAGPAATPAEATSAAASASAATAGGMKPAALPTYPVPCKGCRYIADHKEAFDYTVTPGEGESGNGGAGGWRQQERWELLTGFGEYRISKVGRVNVASAEWLGQDETGPHAFRQVMAYVRRATPPGKAPIQPRIVGGQVQDPTRITDVKYFPRFATSGRTVYTTKKGDPNFVGETLAGLEVVFIADNRGRLLVTIVDPNDVPFAKRRALAAGAAS